MAFDASGNLWGIAPPDGEVIGYRAADLEGSGSPQPAWTLSGVGSPLGSLWQALSLAFDAHGYLWVGDQIGALLAFSEATRLGPNDAGPVGTGPLADFYLTTPCIALEFDGGNSGCIDASVEYRSIAFDSAGNLWTATDQSIAEAVIVAYSLAQVENAPKDDQPVPALSINGRYGFLGPLAFDQDGNLWVGSATLPDPDAGLPNLCRYAVADLPMDGGITWDPLADIAIVVPGYGAETSLAFSPIPSGLPIYP